MVYLGIYLLGFLLTGYMILPTVRAEYVFQKYARKCKYRSDFFVYFIVWFICSSTSWIGLIVIVHDAIKKYTKNK